MKIELVFLLIYLLIVTMLFELKKNKFLKLFLILRKHLNKTKIRINEKQIHDYAMEHHTWDSRIKELIKVLN